MPDIATRTQHEDEIAAGLVLLFSQWQGVPWNRGAFEQGVSRVMRGKLAPIYTEASAGLAGQLGVDVTDAAAQANAQRWEAQYLPTLAAAIAANTDPALEGAFSRERAEMVGITETTRAISTAETALAAFVVTIPVDAGGVNRMDATWYTMKDERVCPICRPLHGHDIDDIGRTPPAHARCRCSILWKQAA